MKEGQKMENEPPTNKQINHKKQKKKKKEKKKKKTRKKKQTNQKTDKSQEKFLVSQIDELDKPKKIRRWQNFDRLENEVRFKFGMHLMEEKSDIPNPIWSWQTAKEIIINPEIQSEWISVA